MSIQLVDVILLLAAAQGLFLCVLLFIRHHRLFANRFLAVLMLLYTILLLHLLITELNEDTFWPHYTVSILAIGFALPPLHYLYAKYLTQTGSGWRKKDGLHFLLPFLYLIVQLPLLLKSRDQLALYMVRYQILGIPVFSVFYNWVIMAQGAVYMYLTYRTLKKYARNIKNIFSSIEKIKLNWLRMNTNIMTVFLSIFFIENIFLLNGINLTHNFTLSSALFAVYVYALGYMGLVRSEVFKGPHIKSSLSHLPEFSGESAGQASGTKYQKSGLGPLKAEQFQKKLAHCMKTEQPFTQSDLTLDQLARHLGISPHNLSQVLNTCFKMNFFDFINHYRLQKVKKDLLDPEKQNFTILAIAFDAGFNSKSSFNAIFKKHTGKTPSQYRRS